MMQYTKGLLLAAILISGCSSIQTPITRLPEGSQATSPDALKTIKLAIPQTLLTKIEENTQSLLFDGIDSPVAAFELPVIPAGISVEIVSQIKDTVFLPQARVVNQNGETMVEFPTQAFRYVKPRLAEGNRLVAEKLVFPTADTKTLTLLVFTDKSQLDGMTPVIHPARLDAEARGNYLPEVKDIQIPHSLTGELSVSVRPPKSGWFSSTQATPAPLPVLSSEQTAVTKQKKVSTLTPQQTTRDYYYKAIKVAVDDGNIDKALALLDEAKTLNVEGAQQVFTESIESRFQ